jgi:hypothetical protein
MLIIGVLYILAMVIGVVALIGIVIVLILSYSMLRLEYKGERKKAEKREFWIRFIFVLAGGFSAIFLSILNASFVSIFAMLLFLALSYKGWFAFIRFFFYLYHKESIKTNENFIKGLKIAPLFVLSFIFLFFNSVAEIGLSALPKASRTYDRCHDNEDWLLGGECSSRDLTIKDVVGKWQMLSNRDVKGNYEHYYFVLKEDKTVEFHSYYVTTEAQSYNTIKYKDINSTWELYLEGSGLLDLGEYNKFHPFITIIMEKGDMLFRFDSGEKEDELYLQNQYDDVDAPHYLTYKKVKNVNKKEEH